MNKNRNVIKRRILTYENQVRTLSIKVYDEQMPEGWEAVKRNIKVMDKSVWQVLAICHDRDPVGDDFWQPSLEKPHYHIIIRVLNEKRMRVKQALKALGIVFREVVDKSLWENHGVETCKDYANMAVYITHETEEAELDGKEKYEIEEIVSNLTIDEINEVRKGYTRVGKVGKLTTKDWAELAKIASNLGNDLADYDDWVDTLSFDVQDSAKMKTVKRSFDRGMAQKLKSLGTIARLCVFVQSDRNMGKTEAAHKALDKLGVEYIDICAGGTGKFDDLTASTRGIVVDDDTLPHLLAMAGARCCKAYRRGSGNRPWIGDYLIVTSNLTFNEWLEECKIDEKHREAARSRFYICHLEEIEGSGRRVLVCSDYAERGGDDYLDSLDAKYEEFAGYFDESLAEYNSIRTMRKRRNINKKQLTPEEEAAYAAKRAAEKAEREAAEEVEKKSKEAAEKAKKVKEIKEEAERAAKRKDEEFYAKMTLKENDINLKAHEKAHFVWRAEEHRPSTDKPTTGEEIDRVNEIYKEIRTTLHCKARSIWQEQNTTEYGMSRGLLNKPTTKKAALEILEIEKLLLETEEVYDMEGEFHADMVEEFKESVEESDKYYGKIFMYIWNKAAC